MSAATDNRPMSSLLDLQGVIQNLASQRRGGLLHVTGPDGQERRLRFQGGQIVAITGGPPDLLPKAIAWSGVLTADQMAMEMAQIEPPITPKQLVKHLANNRILGRDAMLDALDCYVEEEFATVLAWLQPQVTFSDHVEPELWADVQVKVGVSVNTSSMLLEALRRQDELGALGDVMPDPWDVVLREEAIPTEVDNADQQAMLAVVGDGAVVNRITDSPLLPPHRAIMALCQLLRQGVLRVGGVNELVVRADAAHAQDSAKEAYGLYRRAIAKGLDSSRIQLHLGELAERFGENTTAAGYYLAAAPQLADPATAVVALRNALRLGADPEAPLTQLVTLYTQSGEPEQTIDALLELARLYQGRGLLDQALQAVREAQNQGADAGDTALLLAGLAAAQGDGEQAQLQYELAAHALHENDRTPEAIAAWRALMKIAPERIDYARECAELLAWSGDRQEAVRVLLNSVQQGAAAGEDLLIGAYDLLSRLDPGNPAAHAWLAKAYERKRDRHGATEQLRLMAQAQERAGDFDALCSTLERIIELGGQPVDALRQLAKARLKLRQDGLAVVAWAQAIDASQGTTKPKDLRTLIELALADLPAALPLRLRLAQAANREGDRPVAARAYQQAAALAGGQGDPATAREMLLQVCRLRPEDLGIRLQLVEVAEQLHSADLDDILADLIALATRSGNSGVALDYGRRRIGLAAAPAWAPRSELIELLRRAGDHAGELSEGRKLLNDLLEQGEFELAQDLLGRLVASHPRHAELVLQLAEVHAAFGDARQAQRFYRHAVTMLQVDDRLDEARTVLDLLAGMAAEDEDRSLVTAARDRLERGVAVDWEKLRVEAASDERRRAGLGTVGENSASRRRVMPETGQYRKVDTSTAFCVDDRTGPPPVYLPQTSRIIDMRGQPDRPLDIPSDD